MVDERTYDYNGLILGDNNFPVLSVDGLDSPNVRVASSAKAVDHGSWSFTRFLDERRVIISGYWLGDYGDHVDLLRAAFSPRQTDLPLVMHLPGEPERRVHCKPVRKAWSFDLSAAQLQRVNYLIELLAEDPRIYDEVASSLDAAGDAVNEGSEATFPVITITDGWNNPDIRNTSYVGQLMKLTNSGGVGDELVFDFLNRTVEKNGVSVYPNVDPTSVWWPLFPGSNILSVAGVTGDIDITWRNAWI